MNVGFRVTRTMVVVVQVQQKIDELTDLDRILYDAGKKEFEKVTPEVVIDYYDNAARQDVRVCVGTKTLKTSTGKRGLNHDATTQFRLQRILLGKVIA